MIEPALTGKVLDVPAIIDLATGDTKYMRAMAAVANQQGHSLVIPALAFTRALVRLGMEHVDQLYWVLRSASAVMADLDADAAGRVADEAITFFSGDMILAQVSVAARVRRWSIITDQRGAESFTKAGHHLHLLP
ncbi:hypothetical protein [Actinomadura sp. 6N118]|uniref:hypothetical protein n=1 Tax=Actinomadura sp. 6N118 TaxID=3375151 RepID=UPI003792C98F